MITIKRPRILIWNSRQKDINMNYRVINSLLHQHIVSQSHRTYINYIRIHEKRIKKYQIIIHEISCKCHCTIIRALESHQSTIYHNYIYHNSTYPVHRMNSISPCDIDLIARAADSIRAQGESQLQSPNLPASFLSSLIRPPSATFLVFQHTVTRW